MDKDNFFQYLGKLEILEISLGKWNKKLIPETQIQ